MIRRGTGIARFVLGALLLVGAAGEARGEQTSGLQTSPADQDIVAIKLSTGRAFSNFCNEATLDVDRIHDAKLVGFCEHPRLGIYHAALTHHLRQQLFDLAASLDWNHPAAAPLLVDAESFTVDVTYRASHRIAIVTDASESFGRLISALKSLEADDAAWISDSPLDALAAYPVGIG